MKHVVVYVSEQDIKKSKQLVSKPGTFIDKFYDPISIACKRTLNANRVITHAFEIEADGIWYAISNEAREWYQEWARSGEGNPFSFTLTKM